MQLSPAESRRHRRRQEARRAILDATEALMVKSGSSDFAIRRLAERCGYTAPTIYHHFGDKEGVVAALLEERFARLLTSVRQVETGPDPVANLRRMIDAFARFGQENPTFYRLIIAGRSDGADRTPPAAEAARALLEKPWLDLAEAGRLHCANPLAAGQSLWALLHGLTALRAARPEHAWAEDLVEVAVDSLLRGLIKPAAEADR
jgi:AcrR family transcriptional regulator